MSLKVGLVACCLNTEHMRGMGKYVFNATKCTLNSLSVNEP
jgi:hypothetical protein